MQAGKLIHRVTIEQPSTSVDDAGQPAGWEAFASNICARVYEQSGREVINQDRTTDQTTVKVCIRYHDGVKGKMRVVWGERAFEIQSVLNPDGKRIEHELVCVEVANG